MRLLNTGLRIFNVSYDMGFRILCGRVIWYMTRQCVRLIPPRGRRDGKIRPGL